MWHRGDEADGAELEMGGGDRGSKGAAPSRPLNLAFLDRRHVAPVTRHNLVRQECDKGRATSRGFGGGGGIRTHGSALKLRQFSRLVP